MRLCDFGAVRKGVSCVVAACFECRIFSPWYLDDCIVLLPLNNLIHVHSLSMLFFVVASIIVFLYIDKIHGLCLHILPSSPLDMSINLPLALNLQPSYSLCAHMFHTHRYSVIPYLSTIPRISSYKFCLGTSNSFIFRPSSVSLLSQTSQHHARSSLPAMSESIVVDSRESKRQVRNVPAHKVFW